MGCKKVKSLSCCLIAATVTITAYEYFKANNSSPVKKDNVDIPRNRRNPGDMKAYFIGGGLASMAGAVYLIRDCDVKGKNIHIYEGLPIFGGSNDGSGNKGEGFLCRGGRMLNEETYENFWDLLSEIPSLENPARSLKEEILNFDHAHPTCAKARLIDKNGSILDVKRMGFDCKDRSLLLKLMMTPEKCLDDLTIEDWFCTSPHFFTTNFWYMWQTTFAFQKWSSLFEFRRYMNRMIFEFSRIETLEGVTRTPYNQYESVIVPIKDYLEKNGVLFESNTVVTDLDFADDSLTVTNIHLKKDQEERVVEVRPKDLCFFINGCMTDCTTVGSFKHPAKKPEKKPMSALLWAKIAAKKPGLGNPVPFFAYPKETTWLSFTATMEGNMLLKMIEQYSGNIPGSGALMTFKDSSWLMSIVVAAQPHFKAQDANTTIFWGYGLYPYKLGDYVKKPMKDCTGEEILSELLHHLHMEEKEKEIMNTVINVIPCILPYIDAQFEPHKMSDRPQVVPKDSINFAMISQFVEIPKDMVFTEEYSVRAARIAVYTLMNVKRPICPVTPYNYSPCVLYKALIKSLT